MAAREAASNVGAAVLAHVAHSGRSGAALRWKELNINQGKIPILLLISYIDNDNPKKSRIGIYTN